MNALAEAHKDQYQNADPCPHIYFDDFLPEEVAESLVGEFPTPQDDVWGHSFDNEREHKLASDDETTFPPHIRSVLSQFNSSVFAEFLEKLTGIEGLIPDPHYRGGGMHQIIPGGFLKVHVDFNWHDELKIERRLNALLFLNKDWREEYGGHFELWDKDMKESRVKILPVFNRLALFSTSEDSLHGHPEPLVCPEGMTRKSLALYYYTSPATEEQARAAHAHSTVFRERPGEDLSKKLTLKRAIAQIVPPIVFTVFRKLRRK